MSVAKLCAFLGDITDWSVEHSLIDDMSDSALSALQISDMCLSMRVHLVREGSSLCGANSDSGVML